MKRITYRQALTVYKLKHHHHVSTPLHQRILKRIAHIMALGFIR